MSESHSWVTLIQSHNATKADGGIEARRSQDSPVSIADTEPKQRRPVAGLTINITYNAPIVGQKTSKVVVEAVGTAGDEKTEHRNQWTVWGDEAQTPGKMLSDGLLDEVTEILRIWAPLAEAVQNKLWRSEFSQRLLAEIAEDPNGPSVERVRKILAELDSHDAALSRPTPTPKCSKALAAYTVDQVEDAAYWVVRHAQKTGDIPERAKIVDVIMSAVIEDMKGAKL